MTYAEMIALPDNHGLSILDITEEDHSFLEATPTPVSYAMKRQHSTPTSTTHNINISYNHTYSVARNNGDEIDLPSLLQSLAKHTTLQSPSKAIATATLKASDDPSKYKRRKLVLDNKDKPLYFTAADISDPPHLKYHNDLDALVLDWDDSSYLLIKGVPIPLKYWSQVFRWARPEA